VSSETHLEALRSWV